MQGRCPVLVQEVISSLDLPDLVHYLRAVKCALTWMHRLAEQRSARTLETMSGRLTTRGPAVGPA